MTIRLGHLRAFIAVAEHGSVSKAAGVLCRAQSAVTRSVHELERVLEIELFERRAQGMLLTDFGETLLRRARRAAQEFASARDDLADIPGTTLKGRGGPIFSMQVNEQRLQAFIALSEDHHMPTAAGRLGISQPAISASIRELESSLGLALFERTAKGMLPTRHADALVLRIKRALTEVRIAQAEIGALRGVAIGSVTVSVSPLGRALILPRAIARLLAVYPGLHVTTVEAPFDAQVAALKSGDIDFLFGALRPALYGTDLVAEPLLTDELAVIARAGHPLRRQAAPTLEQIAGASWILPHRGTPTRDLLQQMFASRGIAQPNTIVETSDLAVLRGTLRESDLLTAISPQQFDHELSSGIFVKLLFGLPETSRAIGITQRADGHPSPAATLLMNEIKTACREFTR